MRSQLVCWLDGSDFMECCYPIPVFTLGLIPSEDCNEVKIISHFDKKGIIQWISDMNMGFERDPALQNGFMATSNKFNCNNQIQLNSTLLKREKQIFRSYLLDTRLIYCRFSICRRGATSSVQAQCSHEDRINNLEEETENNATA